MTAFIRITTPSEAVIEIFDCDTGNALYLQNIEGIYQAPLRATIDDRPQTDGGIIHPTFKGPRHITIEGVIVPIGTTAAEEAIRNTMIADLIAKLETIENADGTLNWTPTGLTERSLTVRCDVPVTFSWPPPLRTFIFGLVAADPTITVGT